MGSWRRGQHESRGFQAWRCDEGGGLGVLCGSVWFAIAWGI